MKIFASISIRSSFSSCSVLVWICYQGNSGLVECIWKCFLFFYFVEEFEKCWHYFFNNFVEFASEIIWSWAYPLANVFYYWFNLLTYDWSAQIFYFLMIQSGCIFLGIHFFSVSYSLVCWHRIVPSSLNIFCISVLSVIMSSLSSLFSLV